MRVHSSAPTRIDLAGGTLDIWPLYLFHDKAQTLNMAITRRAECCLSPRDDGRLQIISEDTGTAVNVAHASEIDNRSELRLVSHISRYFEASEMTITTRSGSPVGAGLAGSSALNIALCAAFLTWQKRHLDQESLMSLALDIEAQVLRVPTGAQDYRPAVFGGVAALEFHPGRVERIPIELDEGSLADRIVLVYTGQSRNSGVNNWDIMKRHLDGDRNVTTLFDEIRDVAIFMRRAIEANRWDEMARYVGLEWELRKRLAPGVTTDKLDTLIAQGRKSGALAAKVCGAGGGGCVAFFSHPDATDKLRTTLSSAGAQLLDCRIDTKGLQVIAHET